MSSKLYVAGIWNQTIRRVLNISLQAANDNDAWNTARATCRADETLEYVECVE